MNERFISRTIGQNYRTFLRRSFLPFSGVLESQYRTMEKSSRTSAHNFCLEDAFGTLKYVKIGNISLNKALEHVNITSM